MRKLIRDNDGYLGGCLQGYVNATYDELVLAFGSPNIGPNSTLLDKSTCEWNLMLPRDADDYASRLGSVYFSIYDWYTVYTPLTKHQWHIGGTRNVVVDIVHEQIEAIRNT